MKGNGGGAGVAGPLFLAAALATSKGCLFARVKCRMRKPAGIVKPISRKAPNNQTKNIGERDTTSSSAPNGASARRRREGRKRPSLMIVWSDSI